MTQFFLARQPIFDRKLQVCAYELLFRDSRENVHRGIVDDDASTARVIASAAEVGLDKLTRGHRAFINLPQRFLEEPDLLPLDPTCVVPEILETVALNERCIAGIHALRERGFTLALDDFVDSTAFDTILPLVDIVKIDVLALPEARWGEQIARLRRHGCRILAEKVETREAFDTLKALEVDLFQGFFFARPRIVKGRQLSPARVNLIQILAGLNNPQTTVDDIHDLVSRDVALSVKALNYVNSAAGRLTRRIESIRAAIIYLGRDTIRQWVSLYVIASSEARPEERLTLALQRAKVCELLATKTGCGNPDSCFTAGLFSMLDTLLDMPLLELLRQMHLSDDMRAALLTHAGDTGRILAAAQLLEAGDTTGITDLKLPMAELGILQAEALCWTDDALRDLGLD